MDTSITEVVTGAARYLARDRGKNVGRGIGELLEGALSKQALEARGLIHHAPVARLIEDHRANRVDGTDKLLALLNLEIWCRVYLDGRSSSDVADELEEATA